ncbi:MAG: hypothetical protein Q8R24_05510 [Legionellaceae bacterium]|nr:hypothetical protein [Legionellaceae bacterium]
MTAQGLDCNESNTKSTQTENNASSNTKKLETRRRIEDLYEEKKLRDELDIDASF